MRTISYPHTVQKRRARPRPYSITGAIALGFVLLSFVCACVFTLPVLARLVPPRYVARFVPEPLQTFFHTAPVDLPTPMPASAGAPHAVASLLTPIPTVTPLADQPAQPTRQPTSQPTNTPAPRSSPTPTRAITP